MIANWSDALAELVKCQAIPHRAHRVLLYGPPGTGKSSWVQSTIGGAVERITLHQQTPVEDLIGTVGLVASKGGTSTVWQDGPAVRAMRQGIPLVLDEIDQNGPELRCALHAILDDWPVAGVTLPSGERVTPQRGFMVVATTNANPQSFPEALLSRFDLVMLANRPAPGILQHLPMGLANVLERSFDRSRFDYFAPEVSVRSVLSLSRLADAVGLERAAELIFGDNGADILASAAVN